MSAIDRLDDIEVRLASPMVTYKENATIDAPALMEAVKRVWDLSFASDDGAEFPHNDGCTGEPECPACWAEGIRNAITAALDYAS